MFKPIKTVYTMPEWTKELSDDATIGKQAMAEITGRSLNNTSRNVKKGIYPKPLIIKQKKFGNNAFVWRIGDVRKFVDNFNAKMAEPVVVARKKSKIDKFIKFLEDNGYSVTKNKL